MCKFATFLFLLLFTANISSLADEVCPTGMHHADGTYRVTSTIILNGQPYDCTFYVRLCCPDDPFNNEVAIAELFGFSRDCIEAINNNREEFEAWFQSEIAPELVFEACIKPLVPPCTEPNHYRVKIGMAVCRKYKSYMPYPNDPTYTYKMVNCSWSGKCISEWEFCIDYTDPDNPKLIKDFIRRYTEGSPTCTAEPPDILPPPGKTWDEPWETECFLWTYCP